MGNYNVKRQVTVSGVLRQKAEEQLKATTVEPAAAMTDADTLRLLHELQVHQVELEMQNVELLQARNDVEALLEKYTDLYDFAPVGYFTLDAKGTVRSANLTGAGLLRIERSRLLGRRFEQLVSVAGRPEFAEYLRTVSEDRIKGTCEIELLKEGRHPFFVQIKAVVAPSGKGFRLTIIDISERKLTEDKLQRSEHQHAETQSLGQIGIWQWDKPADKISGSDEFFRIFGRTFSHYTDFLNQVHSDDRDRVDRVVQETLELQKPYSDFYRIIRPDGTIRIIIAKGKSIATSNGTAGRFFGTAQDVTERRQLEGQLETLNRELAARASELAAANIELEAFNYSVTHDLRRPLTVINSYCQEVQEMYGNQLGPQFKGYIHEMYDCTLRMNGLIDTLLNFSCVSRVEMRHDPVDLSMLAHDVADKLKLQSPHNRATFQIEEGIQATGDAGLLRIVLDNLMGNAWKFTSNLDGAIIDFGMKDLDGRAEFYVRDNGPGFDNVHAEKLFIPFHRLPGVEEFRGHGIGLATVERIIRRHGGAVRAEGDPGKGACFSFSLSAA